MYIESEIERVLDEMTTLTDWAMDTVNHEPTTSDVGDWNTGGDDSAYDYIPQGLETLSWLAAALSTIHYHCIEPAPGDEDYTRFREHYSLPCFFMDSISTEMCDRCLYLAIKLGYTQDQLITDAGWYDLEDVDEDNNVIANIPDFVAKFERDHNIKK